MPMLRRRCLYLSCQAHKVSLKYTNAPASLSVTSLFSVVRRQQCSAWPIKAKFHVEPPLEGGTKVYINGLGHMTKMAVMPIYG